MARLNNPSLTVKLISGTPNVDVVAKVNVSLDQLEQFLVTAGLQLRIKCKLVGADSGFNGSDDDLYLFSPKTVSTAGEITFTSTIPKATLNEDSIGNDEVYANFCLTSGNPIFPLSISANSPQIVGDF